MVSQRSMAASNSAQCQVLTAQIAAPIFNGGDASLIFIEGPSATLSWWNDACD
jgi:hypothetical protein